MKDLELVKSTDSGEMVTLANNLINTYLNVGVKDVDENLSKKLSKEVPQQNQIIK